MLMRKGSFGGVTGGVYKSITQKEFQAFLAKEQQ